MKKQKIWIVLIGTAFLYMIFLCLFVFLSHHNRVTTMYKANTTECSYRVKYRRGVVRKGGIAFDNGILPQSAKNLTLNDITLTIKTGYNLADARLDNILQTWYPQAKESVIFITDTIPLKLRSKGRVVETSCATGHSKPALNCKMGAEFEEYRKRRTKWWCHMDDDNYVNTNVLLRLLSKYDPQSDVYIGRPSRGRPVTYAPNTFAWFAHGGCGFCVSRALTLKMVAYISGGGLISMHRFLNASDDCAVGFIINYVLGTKLTVSNLFNSHHHRCEMGDLTLQEIRQQATLSYSRDARVRITSDEVNWTRGFFTEDADPSRFFTVHCLLNPETDYCLNGVL